MANDFEHINFNNEDLIVLRRINDFELGEIIQCMSDEGVIYLNNDQIITEKTIIDRLDEQFWRSSKLRGFLKPASQRHNSIRNLNRQSDGMER